MMIRLVLLATATLIGLGWSATAQTGAPYPYRPIKLVVPFAPGGADIMARLIGERITTALGQPVVVENRPGGAGGTVGTKSVTTADPDGYTLTLASPGPITVAPAVNKTLDYDPLKQLTAVAVIARSPFVLVMNSDRASKYAAGVHRLRQGQPGQDQFCLAGIRNVVTPVR